MIHLDICSVGRYSPTKLRNGAFLLAAEVNHLLLNALLLARFCSVGRNLVNSLLLDALLLAAEVNHLLLKPIGKQDYSP